MARGHDDDGAGSGERLGGLKAETGIAAGDDGDFAGEIAPAKRLARLGARRSSLTAKR